MLHVCPACRNPDPEKELRPGDAEEGYAVAVCPDCGEPFRFRYIPLYSLEGAPGVGKSTVAGRLDDIERTVYEGDVHIDLTGGKLSWAEICALDFRICLGLHAAGRPALLVGGMYPHEPAESPETRYVSRVERCALVCGDADLRARLEARGMAEEAVADCLDVNRWYREESPEAVLTVNATERDPDAVAERVRAWLG